MATYEVELDGWTPVDVDAKSRSAARYAAFKLLRDSALDHPPYSDAASWRQAMTFKEFCQRTKVRS